MSLRWGLLVLMMGLATHVACGLFVSADDYDREYGRDSGADALDAAQPDATTDAPAACSADLTTDPLNCGACGRSCAGRACAGGLCATVNAYPGIPASGLSLGDAGIYIGAVGSPSVIALLGYDLVPGPLVAAGDLAFAVVAEDAVYWTEVGGAVRSVPLDLQGQQTVIGRSDASAALMTKRRLSALYWTVRASSAAGGGLYTGLGADTATRLEPAEEAFGITDDDTYVYYAHRVRGGTITRRQKAGAESTVLATATGVPIQLAADDFYVYFADCEQGTVERIAKDGTGKVVLASGMDHPYAVALDGDQIYVSTLGANLADCTRDQVGTAEVATIERITKSTKQRVVLAAKQTGPLFLATHPNSPFLYWSSATGAKAGVWNVPK